MFTVLTKACFSQIICSIRFKIKRCNIIKKCQSQEEESDQYRFLQNKGTFQEIGDEILRAYCRLQAEVGNAVNLQFQTC
jgi:hypothetical protein